MDTHIMAKNAQVMEKFLEKTEKFTINNKSKKLIAQTEMP